MSCQTQVAARPRVLFALSTLLVSTTLSNAYADDTASSTVAPVIVSATRNPTPADQVASSVTVITSDDIAAKQEQTLPEVLQDVPGLNLAQTGSPGGAASVYIRGANANHTKVLIDGIDVSDPSSVDGSFDFSQILASDIERIEVLRGPQSGLYGSDAIGGVINITTKTGKGPAQFTGMVEGGSFATFNQTAGVSGSTDRFNYNLSAAHFYTGEDPVTPTNLLAPGFHRNDDSSDNKTISAKLGANLTDNFDVGLVAHFVGTQLDATSDGPLVGDPYGPSFPEALRGTNDDHALFTRGTAHLTSFDGQLDQTIGLGYTQYHRTFLDPNATAYQSFGQYEGDRTKADYQGNIKLTQGQTLTLGLEHQLDQINDPSQPVSAQMSNNAADIQLQSEFTDRIFNTISLRDDDNSMFGSKATYRIAPAYLLKETDTKLKASYGTGYKAPTLDELFDNYPAYSFFANPNLKPETSKGYDFGFEQNLFKKEVQFGSTYFHNNIHNLISSLYDPVAMTSTSVNIGQATTWGFENFVAYKPWNILTLRADYTFTIAEDDIANQELTSRPKNKASLNATWQAMDKWSLTGSVLYTGQSIEGNRDFSITRMKAGSYATANLAAEYAWTDNISPFLRITNLLDRRYQEPIGFEQQGFGAFAGIKIKY